MLFASKFQTDARVNRPETRAQTNARKRFREIQGLWGCCWLAFLVNEHGAKTLDRLVRLRHWLLCLWVLGRFLLFLPTFNKISYLFIVIKVRLVVKTRRWISFIPHINRLWNIFKWHFVTGVWPFLYICDTPTSFKPPLFNFCTIPLCTNETILYTLYIHTISAIHVSATASCHSQNLYTQKAKTSFRTRVSDAISRQLNRLWQRISQAHHTPLTKAMHKGSSRFPYIVALYCAEYRLSINLDVQYSEITPLWCSEDLFSSDLCHPSSSPESK